MFIQYIVRNSNRLGPYNRNIDKASLDYFTEIIFPLNSTRNASRIFRTFPVPGYLLNFRKKLLTNSPHSASSTPPRTVVFG